MRQRVAEQAFQRDFAQRAARLRAAQNRLQRLRGFRKILAGLLHFADFLAHLQQGFGGGLQLLRHVALRVRGELAGGGDAGLQFLPHLAELLRHRLHQID